MCTLIVPMLLSACSAVRHGMPMPPEVSAKGLVLKRALPEQMPEQSAPVPGSQLVLVPSENAAGMLVPIPFVSELAIGAYNQSQASGLGKHYAALDVFGIVQGTMADSPLLRNGGSKISLYPIVYLAECSDGQYRLSLAGRIESGGWVGRYVAHLPTTYGDTELAAAAPSTITTMQRELQAAALTLRQLIESDARGDFGKAQYRADLGSLHLACARVGGLVSADLMLARDAEVVEEDAGHVVVRIAGDLSQAGPSGGLMYGLHYLRKQQLHTFKKKPG
ncbi:hypothetical protein SAMN05192549_10499 [Duganella sacchari]|uniref:Uncharacterized protein n=2 Tax=Duganella sacchari TaxID=551987 RepID=A0A1M7NPN8_9BURK|nr:hypothetical protein SAMN05192549_10499 [Duganella sacchari]